MFVWMGQKERKLTKTGRTLTKSKDGFSVSMNFQEALSANTLAAEYLSKKWAELPSSSTWSIDAWFQSSFTKLKSRQYNNGTGKLANLGDFYRLGVFRVVHHRHTGHFRRGDHDPFDGFSNWRWGVDQSYVGQSTMTDLSLARMRERS